MHLLTRKAASVAALTVLGLTAGGIAWAESASSPAPASATAAASQSASVTDRHGMRLRGLGKRVLHGEVVLQTRKGFVTAVIARGTVTAVDANSISVKSADGVTTTFTIDAKTKARSAGKVVPVANVHQGDTVGVLGVKNGSAVVAKLIRERPAKATTSG
jgi:hypothetical protein